MHFIWCTGLQVITFLSVFINTHVTVLCSITIVLCSITIVLGSILPADSDKLQDYRIATLNDRILSLLMHEVYHGWPQVHIDCCLLLLDYWNFRDEISLDDGLLFKGHRFIMPEGLRGETLKQIHEGHYGVEKSLLTAREAVFWPRITQNRTNEVQNCKTCQVYSKSHPKETLQQHEIPTQPWIKIGTDLFELQSTH